MIVVGGLALDHLGRALMGLRPRNKIRPGMWEYPGGKVEEGETLPDAVRREWMEEVGVSVQVGPFVGECSLEVEEPILWRLYHVTLDSIELKPNAHDELLWISPMAAIQTFPCTPTTYLVFRQVLRFIAAKSSGRLG